MTAIQFYHLTTTSLERALPKLLEKAYSVGMKTLVVTASEEQMESLNQWLWTYNPGNFLPHGSVKEAHQAQQPILLSTSADNQNQATLLVVTDGSMPDAPEQFERVFDLFNGSDPQAVEAARRRWSHYKTAGHELTYMRQTPQGSWENKTGA
ncbi:MAG: DNA polymerase III subunit chi [Rickettsiales bacterium]|nr:DNA polymerase III subunit chi [Rickettsiales bacterium]